MEAAARLGIIGRRPDLYAILSLRWFAGGEAAVLRRRVARFRRGRMSAWRIEPCGTTGRSLTAREPMELDAMAYRSAGEIA